MIPSFFRVRTLEQTASTNEDVKKEAARGEAEGLVLRAKSQSAGKGRHGRVWDSPEGNLYASVLLRPACAPREIGLYSFVAALAVQDAIQKLAPQADIKLKWPNDVLVSGKKISGILLESLLSASGSLEGLVLGVGVNVARHPDGAFYPTTSLLEAGVAVEVEDVLEAFLNGLDHWRQTLARDGFRPVRRAFEASALRGEMSVRLPAGLVRGTFAGIDGDGRLILRLADGGEQSIETGDVFL